MTDILIGARKHGHTRSFRTNHNSRQGHRNNKPFRLLSVEKESEGEGGREYIEKQ